jgi:hypothetical protein
VLLSRTFPAISVGYRVKSHRGTQFGIWATQRLREYIVKGFTLDDERLKRRILPDFNAAPAGPIEVIVTVLLMLCGGRIHGRPRGARFLDAPVGDIHRMRGRESWLLRCSDDPVLRRGVPPLLTPSEVSMRDSGGTWTSPKRAGRTMGLARTVADSGASSRRAFFGALGAAGAVAAFPRNAAAATVGPLNPTQRRDRAFQIRSDRATANRTATNTQVQPTNGDEEAHANKIGSYTKGLPHNARGEVDINAFDTLGFALRTGTPSAFEAITLGGTRKLVNPQAGWAFDMEGGDGPSFKVSPPPQFSSRETAAEVSENYWMALLRDVPFAEYASNPIAADAARDMTAWGADAKVPKNGSTVTPDLLFRGLTPGDRVGPYVSQFLLLPCPFGPTFVEQRILHPLAGVDFLTAFSSFLAVQNGQGPLPALTFEATPRYVRSGRGLGEWVHNDFSYQAFLMAFFVLAANGAPFDPGIPYVSSAKQVGFATFGGPHVLSLIAEVANRALQATWYQKWFAHRRLRPEAYAGAVHTRLYQSAVGDGSQDRFPVHPEILASLQSSSRLGRYIPAGNALLRQAYPEASPTHPAYTAGHATIAGACVTILKAFFNESFVLPNPRQPSTDGLTLQPFTGPSLTVGGELNKLASNIGQGRNMAGIHWRSDTTASLLLGEALAIQLLTEHRPTFNETFSGFTITKLDGSTVVI